MSNFFQLLTFKGDVVFFSKLFDRGQLFSVRDVQRRRVPKFNICPKTIKKHFRRNLKRFGIIANQPLYVSEFHTSTPLGTIKNQLSARRFRPPFRGIPFSQISGCRRPAATGDSGNAMMRNLDAGVQSRTKGPNRANTLQLKLVSRLLPRP
jgi:hypothetical protein